ncbi:hypothetical protein [Celerinatantimonas sp. YJH-8]|uniref:hypothetical protein n=1 Tax=Celerinatantimonas sp. YJH-8 TaxID=3228714 RepID=UPI0038C09BC3
MADVEYQLGAPIALEQMLPAAAGVATAIPAAFTNTAGVYLILNQNNLVENRYMGITHSFQDRFRGRQGACYELGFAQNVLHDIYAFVGSMRYRDSAAAGALPPAWNNAPGYVAGHLTIHLDGQNYDLEHMFIKAAQYSWPLGTITNTQKVGPLNNTGAYPINITLSWMGAFPGNIQVTIPVGGSLN